MSLSLKISSIAESPTLGLNAKVKELASSGVDVTNFTVGEPDFDTPDNVKRAAIDAIKAGFTKYTPVSGIPELRKAIAAKLKAENGADYSPDQIIVSCGGKHSLYNAFQALCNPGDEVIIPAPYWVTYPEQVKMADAKPVFARTKERNGFRLLAKDIEEKLTKSTKAVVLNSPNNPTGAVYEKSELKKIASIAVDNDLYVISDEVYECLVFEGRNTSIASLGEDIKARTVIVNAASKTYSMTGWRIGWAAGPPDVVKAMSNLQSHMTSNPNSIAQKAYLAGLTGSQESVKRMAAEFRKRRDLVVKRLNGITGVCCARPQGAFYAFPNVTGCFRGSIRNSMEFSMNLLEKARVAVVPGVDFGAEGHVRISYACSMETIEKGMDRLEDFVRKF